MYNDRELLAKTLMAEAGNQGPLGMLAAGSVIMNRVRSGNYGKGLPGVILKPGAFSPWNSVTGFAGGEQGQDMARITPNEQAYRIADALLSGQYEDPTGNATHFYNPDISDPSWGIRGGNEWRRIGEHVFGRADDKAKGPSRVINVGSDAPKLVASDTMAALGKGGGAVTPDQIAQGAQAQSTGMQDEQRPRGLLGGLFGNPDTMANLALAFNSMRLNPDPNLGAVLTAQMEDRRDERETKRQRNATAQWLRSQKLDSLAQAVETGALTGAQAISLAKTESGEGTAAMQNYARYQQIAATEGPEAAEKFRKMFLGGQDINIDLSKGELSPGWKKIDEKFAETFNEWNIAGASDALKQTSQLRGVLNDLREGKPLTGPLLGLQPDVVQSFLNPDALNARQQVEEVVQRNLRKILGAQFTKEEGERLISRSFDQRLSPEQNAARLEALLNQMETAAQNTAAMVNHFQEKGTLRGYEGNQFSSSISSFDQMFDALDRQQGLSGGKSGGEGTMANPFKITPQTKPSDIPSGAYFIDPNGVLRQKP